MPLKRHDFTKATIRTIAARAGNECSYPTCHVRTTGPDTKSQGHLQAGVAAHIYGASPNGPRGQGGLSKQELQHPENGIWLCSVHAKLIDDNNGVGHPAEKLLTYKRLHEHRVQKEVLGLCPTIGWIDEFELVHSPLFANGAKVRMGKLNLLFGDNSVGKTTFGKFLGGIFDNKLLGHWHKPGEIDLDLHVSYYNPDPVSISFSVNSDNPVRYEIDGVATSKNPIHCNVIVVPEFDYRYASDDLAFVARTLSMPNWEVESLLAPINSFPHSNFRNYRFEPDDGAVTLHVNVTKDARRIFPLLASTEQKLVLVDFATAAARQSSKKCQLF